MLALLWSSTISALEIEQIKVVRLITKNKIKNILKVFMFGLSQVETDRQGTHRVLFGTKFIQNSLKWIRDAFPT
jgi:hypothetical protein